MAASKVLSTGIPCTLSLRENYVRPESDRPNLSDVDIDCVDIPAVLIDLNHTYKTQTIRRINDAGQNFGFFQVINHGTSTESSNRTTLESYSGDDDQKSRHCSHWRPSVPPSFKAPRVNIHVSSNHIQSSFNSTNLRDVAQSSSGSSHPLVNLQGSSQLNGFITKIGNNIIACECDGFIQVIHSATPAHGDYGRAAASFSPNQQLASVELDNKNGPLNDHELIMTPGIISSIFKENDIGKTVLGYVLSALVALLMNTKLFPSSVVHVLVIAFSVGMVLIWNGMMLRNRFPSFGRAAEKAGVVMIFLGFFGLAASVLPLALVWAPLLCGVLFLLPFILRVLPASHCNLLFGANRSKGIGATSPRQPPLLPIYKTSC